MTKALSRPAAHGDVLPHAAAKAILIGPALGTTIGVVAELAGPGHVVGVVLGGSRQGRVHPVRPQTDPPADVVVPHQHAKQRRVAMQRPGLRRWLVPCGSPRW